MSTTTENKADEFEIRDWLENDCLAWHKKLKIASGFHSEIGYLIAKGLLKAGDLEKYYLENKE